MRPLRVQRPASPAETSRRQFLRHAAYASGLWYCSRAAWGEATDERLAFAAVECEGRYRAHLQGICTDRRASLYWSFTDQLVKTDRNGRIVKKVPVANHHGDLCHADGKVYVAVNLGKFNRPAGQADSWVYVYDAETLAEVKRYAVPEAVHGAGGMDVRDGRFFVVGGLPEDVDENYVFEYDGAFRFVKRHVIASGYTLMGIQTATFFDGHWWFGCYGRPAELLKTDAAFEMVGKWNFDCALGLIGYDEKKFLVARGGRDSEGHRGRIVPAMSDETSGLKLVEK